MHAMKNLFIDILESSMAVLFYNIFLYSCMVEEHCILLGKVLAYLCYRNSTSSFGSTASYDMS